MAFTQVTRLLRNLDWYSSFRSFVGISYIGKEFLGVSICWKLVEEWRKQAEQFKFIRYGFDDNETLDNVGVASGVANYGSW